MSGSAVTEPGRVRLRKLGVRQPTGGATVAAEARAREGPAYGEAIMDVSVATNSRTAGALARA